MLTMEADPLKQLREELQAHNKRMKRLEKRLAYLARNGSDLPPTVVPDVDDTTTKNPLMPSTAGNVDGATQTGASTMKILSVHGVAWRIAIVCSIALTLRCSVLLIYASRFGHGSTPTIASVIAFVGVSEIVYLIIITAFVIVPVVGRVGLPCN